MTDFTVRRMLGPIITEMGGSLSGSGGSGGDGLTITNNVSGYVLKATGEANRIEGIPQLQYDAGTSTLNANANLYVSGSTNYLYIHGTNEAGEQVKFKVAVQGHILDISGSTS
jgi:hypothetical protein